METQAYGHFPMLISNRDVGYLIQPFNFFHLICMEFCLVISIFILIGFITKSCPWGWCGLCLQECLVSVLSRSWPPLVFVVLQQLMMFIMFIVVSRLLDWSRIYEEDSHSLHLEILSPRGLFEARHTKVKKPKDCRYIEAKKKYMYTLGQVKEI